MARYYVVMQERTRTVCDCPPKTHKKNQTWDERVCTVKKDVTTWEGVVGRRASGQMTVYSTLGYAKCAAKRVSHGRYGTAVNAIPTKILSFELDNLDEVTDDQWQIYQDAERKMVDWAVKADTARKRMAEEDPNK